MDLKKALEEKTISPHAVRPDGSLTSPRSYGVYKVPVSVGGSRRVRFGNHTVRMTELEREFGSCELCHLFLHREDAAMMAELLNGEAP